MQAGGGDAAAAPEVQMAAAFKSPAAQAAFDASFKLVRAALVVLAPLSAPAGGLTRATNCCHHHRRTPAPACS
jgi:hypothetical protein